MTSKNEISAHCQNCIAGITVSFEELVKDGCVVCPNCLKVNIFDVEKYKRQTEALITQIIRNRPIKPENN
jgi:uncharacterized Zn finger protein (UPF0148 family)